MNIIGYIKYKIWRKRHSRYCEFMRKKEDKKKVEFLVDLLEDVKHCPKHIIAYYPYGTITQMEFCPECYQDKIISEAWKLNTTLNKKLVELEKKVKELSPEDKNVSYVDKIIKN